MRILIFSKADISKGHLILVNPFHPLTSDMPKNQLVPVRTNFAHVLLEQQTARMLAEITARLRCERDMVPVSGFRTMEEQQDIYADSLRKHGNDFTQKYVAFPGCSEHQTGLAIDLAENHNTIDFIRPNFPYSGIFGDFRALCSKYGFIERYPAGREQITGIAHEPWHFRYVGYPHSEIIKENAFALENYTDYLKQFPYKGDHLRWKCNQREFEIFNVPVRENKDAIVEISDGIPFQVSGNNENGVVVTLWRDRL
jgi:D-alanyl-D-alanine dipeptidase/carboxypeptidase